MYIGESKITRVGSIIQANMQSAKYKNTNADKNIKKLANKEEEENTYTSIDGDTYVKVTAPMKLGTHAIEVNRNIQKREEERINTKMNIGVRNLIYEGSKLDLVKPLSMSARNISTHGILLMSHLDIPTIIELILQIQLGREARNIIVNARIVRKELLEKAEYNHVYGCKLSFDTSEDEQLMKSYIIRSHTEAKSRLSYVGVVSK